MSFTLCCHNYDLVSACTITFPPPGTNLIAEFLDRATIADPTTGNDRSTAWGKFHVNQDNYEVIHSLGNNSAPGAQTGCIIRYSSDGGLSWETKTELPALNYTDPVPTNTDAYPTKWDFFGGGHWEVWTSNDNTFNGYYRTNDNGDTWIQYPLERNPNTNTSPLTTNLGNPDRVWTSIDKEGSYWQLGEDMYNPFEEPAYRYQWAGLWKRDKQTSQILSELQIRSTEFTNNNVIEIMQDGLLAGMFNDINNYRRWYAIAPDGDSATGGAVIETLRYGRHFTNNRRWIIIAHHTQSNGVVRRWDVLNPLADPIDEIILPGNYGVSTTGSVKPYLYLYVNFEGAASRTCKLYYSQYSDSGTIQGGDITLELPSLPDTGIQPILKAGPDNYWYLAYRENESPNVAKWLLCRFQFETLSCPPDQYGYLDES